MAEQHIFIGLGSNLGDRGQNVQKALVQLEQWGMKIVRTSSLYETEPLGPPEQPLFLNMVAEIATEKSPQEVLMVLQAIERASGRVRTPERWGPRSLDLDLLLYGDLVLQEPGLEIPHPRLHERKFVLVPLAEIAAGVVHPLRKKTIAQLLEECPDRLAVKLFQAS